MQLVQEEASAATSEGESVFVDNAREKNKARTVVEICLNRGRYPVRAYTLLIPLFENRKRC